MLPDPHAPFIQELVDQGDWSAIVRYWIAHGLHRPAINAVIDLVERDAGPYCLVLARFLKAIADDPFVDFPEELAGYEGDELESVTLVLLEQLGRFCLCQLAAQAPNEQCWDLFQIGIQTAHVFVQIGQAIDDSSLTAVAFRMLAHAHQELHELSNAAEFCSQALEFYRRLALVSDAARTVFEPEIAMTLETLGTVLRDLRRPEQSVACYREAVEIYRRLALASDAARTAFEPNVAMTLNSLGNLLRDLRRLEEAEIRYRDAVEIYRRLASGNDSFRIDFEPSVATILNNLGNLQGDNGRPEEAETCFREALEIRRRLATTSDATRASHELDVGATLNSLGKVLSDQRRLEEAETCFREALEIRRRLASTSEAAREAIAPKVAGTLNSLGGVLNALRRLADAEACFREADEIYHCLASTSDAARAVFEPNVAMTLNNLGIVLRDLLRLEEAETRCRDAVAIYRRLASANADACALFEPNVAMVLINLGNILSDLSRQEDAEGCFREALEIRLRLASASDEARAAFEPHVADSLNNLGKVQRDLRRLNEAETNFREAERIYRRLTSKNDAARMVLEPKAAMVLNNLGTVLSDLHRLDEAETCFREALRIRRCLASASDEARTVFEPDVAATLNNLGDALCVLQRRDEAETCYREALRIHRRMASASDSARAVVEPDVASALNNLGTVLFALYHLEEAETCFREALEIRIHLASASDTTGEVFEPDVAMTYFNLGILLRNLRRLDEAEACHREAIKTFRRLASASDADRAIFEPKLAAALNNLGNVLRELHSLKAAETAFREADEIYRHLASISDALRAQIEPDMAGTLSNIGNVLEDMCHLDGAETSYREVLTIRRRLAYAGETPRTVFEPDVAVTHYNLANVLRKLHRFEEAERSYCEAEEIYERLSHQLLTNRLAEREQCYHNHGLLLLSDELRMGWPDRHRARVLLRAAAGFSERMRGLFVNPTERIRMQDESFAHYTTLVRVNLDIGYLFNEVEAFGEAVEWAEASRSRVLLESLADEEFDLSQAPFEMRDEFRRLRKELRRAMRRLQQEMEVEQALARHFSQRQSEDEPLPPGDSDASESGEGTRSRMGTLAHSAVEDSSAVMRTDTSAHPLETQLRVVRTPDLVAELHQTADRQTQIRTLETRIGSLLPQYQKLEEKIVQAVPGFDPNPIVAPFRVHALSQLLPTDRPTAYIHLHWFGDEAHAVVMSALGSHPVRLPGLTRETLNDALMPLAAMQFSKSEARQLGPAITAVTALVGDQLRRHLIEPLLPVIEQANAQRLVFVPEGAMSFLPLHAVPLSESEHLVDRYEVAYAPSLSILDQCRRRKRSHPTRYVNAVNPLKEPDFARLEADMVREHFAESQVIAASDVTRDSFLKEAPWGHVVSWSGHARFLPMVPLWSGLVCHRANDSVPPDDVISMMDIDAGLSLPDCTLAVLAGCQSGLALAGAGNEYVSLVGAFLNAGAQCALASLWPVDDFATMLTIERFFHHWRAGQTMAASLRTTQQWLRTTTAPELQEHIRREILPKTSDPDENIARRVKVLGFMADDNRPYESPFYWAPFVVVGLSYPLENGNEIAGRM